MATIFKTRQGHWRAQMRPKGKYVSNTFHLKTQAHEWVRDVEHLIDIGGEPRKQSRRRLQTVGALVDLHLEDLKEVGRPIRRSKMAVMDALKRDLGADGEQDTPIISSVLRIASTKCAAASPIRAIMA